MINSILDREKQAIVIDRLVVKQDDKNIELILDHDKIKDKVIDHFQKCALPPKLDSPPPMPQRWIDQYTPKDYINATVYDPVVGKIDEEEWHDTIRNLPSNKATGPSGISNEMIKHLSPLINKTLLYLANMCLSLGDIPGD